MILRHNCNLLTRDKTIQRCYIIMKNLVLNRCQAFGDSHLKDSAIFCVDPELNTVYFISEKGLVSCSCSEKNEFSVLVATAKFSDYVRTKLVDEVVSITYLTFEQSVCMITASGNVLLYNCIEATGDVVCSGVVDSGIAACSWSPDQEAVVIYTGVYGHD